MKVLHIINNLTSGGAESLLKEMLPLMKEYKIESEVLILSRKDNVFKKDLKISGIPVHETGFDNVYSPFQIFKIVPYLKNYNIVHVHLFPAQYWVVIAKVLSRVRIPIITTEHSTNNRRRGNIFFKIMDGLIYRKFEKIICISKSTEQNLVKWLPEIKTNTVTINNGVNFKRFKSAQAYEISELIPLNYDEIKIVLMVARMSHQKDHKTIIKAIELLPKEYQLILVGDGPLKEDLISFVTKRNLQSRVHFLGIRRDIPRIMKTADVFVLSSFWEGFGLVAVEAMASGLPVIATDVPGLSNIVGARGELFPVGDFEILAKKIQNYTDNNNYINTLDLEQEYGLENMIKQYITIYLNL